MKRSFYHANTSSSPIALKRQPYYCEENAWHLCQEPFFENRPRHVVFISNHERAMPMWNQRAGRGKAIVWDYHVVVLAESPVEIWDVDTQLGIPSPLFDYLQGSFHPQIPEKNQPCFRLVQADIFVDLFSSDRSHMQRPDGSFRKPVPSWAVIGKPGIAPNLMQFIDMNNTFVGDVLSLDDLRQRFDPS